MRNASRDSRGAMASTKSMQASCLPLKKGLRVKVNMVVLRGVNDDELLRFVEFTR